MISDGYFRYLTKRSPSSSALEYKLNMRYLIKISLTNCYNLFSHRHLQRASGQKKQWLLKKADDFPCSVVFKRVNNNQFQHIDL
jgi:hypothetical protein